MGKSRYERYKVFVKYLDKEIEPLQIMCDNLEVHNNMLRMLILDDAIPEIPTQFRLVKTSIGVSLQHVAFYETTRIWEEEKI